MRKSNKMSPEEKLLNAMFGYGQKSDDEFEKESNEQESGDIYTGYKTNHENTMLFINAMNRKDELEPMVEQLIAGKYFPNEHYRNVFRWSLMQAAQWQYEKLNNI